MTQPVPLPASCRVCVYYTAQSRCVRHAPSQGPDELEIAYWPVKKPTDRCGQGAAITDGTGSNPTRCQSCLHWWLPGGVPVNPDGYRKGLPQSWWDQAGLCTSSAPMPSTEDDQKTFHRVTNAMAECGDGAAVDADLAATASDPAAAAPPAVVQHPNGHPPG